jgi:hypothetical protein
MQPNIQKEAASPLFSATQLPFQFVDLQYGDEGSRTPCHRFFIMSLMALSKLSKYYPVRLFNVGFLIWSLFDLFLFYAFVYSLSTKNGQEFWIKDGTH